MALLVDILIGTVAAALGGVILAFLLPSTRRNRVLFWRTVIITALAGAITAVLTEPLLVSNDAGWKNLPWGAAIAEVKRELPGIKEIPPNSNIPASNSEHNFFFTKPGMRLYLSDYDLDGAPATVIFSFDSYDKLEEVNVLSDTWRTQAYADRILLDLTTKYGNPRKDDKEDKAGIATLKAEWINKNTVIIFSTKEYGHDGEIEVSVVYRRGPLGALNKI
jgi:hypothetical protein